MQRKIVFLRQELTTRRYAFIWISIWLILIFSTWFSRPLIPFQETFFSGVVWEYFTTGMWLYPHINETYQHGVYPLNYWLGYGVWKLFGVSEFSLRALASFFSLGTLFLTAWAAYQLWPDRRDVRANAPLVLIGSLMWTMFATASIEYLFFTFYLMLTINFLIRVWRFDQKGWWIGFIIGFSLGLFSSGPMFMLVVLPIIALAPYWAKKEWREIYLWGVISILIALIGFGFWAYFIADYLGFAFIDALGLPFILKALNNSTPFYIYLINLVVILFPWLFWLKIYRQYRELQWDDSFRFVVLWMASLILILGVLSLTSLDALLPLYPALGLTIARIYRSGASTRRDIFLITAVVALIGVLLIVIPKTYEVWNLPSWVGDISPFWGAGLLLFSITFFLNAANTRIMTLALMSVALTLSINFGVVRVATDFYDLKPIGERVSWYQTKGYTVAHQDSYRGHLHFEGRLRDKILELNTPQDLELLAHKEPNARVILYVSNLDQINDSALEYWQPFRGRYLVVVKADQLLKIYQESNKSFLIF